MPAYEFELRVTRVMPTYNPKLEGVIIRHPGGKDKYGQDRDFICSLYDKEFMSKFYWWLMRMAES
jgi:hypothetical protein